MDRDAQIQVTITGLNRKIALIIGRLRKSGISMRLRLSLVLLLTRSGKGLYLLIFGTAVNATAVK